MLLYCVFCTSDNKPILNLNLNLNLNVTVGNKFSIT